MGTDVAVIPRGIEVAAVGILCVCVCVCVCVFFGQLSSGKRPQCGPVRRYKDTVKTNMKRCGLRPHIARVWSIIVIIIILFAQ